MIIIIAQYIRLWNSSRKEGKINMKRYLISRMSYGYIIGYQENKTRYYLKSIYNGNCKYTLDYCHAKPYKTRNAAVNAIDRIIEKEGKVKS